MGKTRNTGKLATQIQFDNSNNLVIGNSTSSSFNTSGSVNAIGGITGSIFGIGDPTSFSASISSNLVSIQSVTASNIVRLSNLESKSSSVDISVSSINTFTSSNAIASLNSKTGSYATTGSNSFYGTQVFSGSVYIANDLVVQGSSSIQYISASSVSIGTNIVQLNTANPSVRFAGLTVIDSGSIGGSGSFLYDSVQDEFIFVHRGNGTNITSSHFVLGPETYDSLGNETYLTSNIIPKGTGKEHLIDSCIFDNGTTTCIKNNLVAGVGNFSNCLTFGDWTTAANVLSSNKPNEQGAYIRAAVSIPTNPTYAFEDDQDTGMYRDGANSLGFATDGYARMTISSTGYSLFNGTVAIQGACSSRICLIKDYSGSPSNPGFVITDTSGVITFNHNANGGGTSISGVTCIGSNFCVTGASYFAGNVSIGTTSNLTSGNYSSIRLGTIANWWAGNGVSSGDFYLQGNSYYNGSSLRYIRTDAATEYSQVSGVHAWSTAASGTAGCSITMVERMRISNTGLVGIGTINPDYNLVICCSGQVIANVRTNSTTAGSESGILITTPDSIGLLTVGASSGRGVNDAARCDMVMGLRTGGKIRFSTDINANTTQVSIANGITSFTCQMCAPYAIFSGTAAITLPVGTTGQRTGPSTGMIRFNSSCTELEYYNGNDWLFFTSTPQSQGYYADVLVVAGGGGGGGAEASNGYGGGGAGGGAGGYAAGRIFINYTNCGYPISIGSGGTGGANNPQATGSGCNGTMGTASCALGLIAIGGGFGGGDETQTGGGNGGSGGGNGGDNSGTQGCGTLGQGCAGGYSQSRNGGGGGGASTTGCHGYTGTGAGGQGRAWYNGTTYAGGGGGGNGAANNTTTSGGAGGGGNGSATDGTSGNQVAGGTATAGTANTGGGGGGGAAGRAQGGQNGGSGIVIVRYYGSQKGFGGTITSSGGYTYHSFTSSGTYCATYY